MVDPLRDLDLFVAVGRARSFSAAALRLGIPTSTLSRRIAALEQRLGVALFARTTRRVELTDAARAYLVRCEAIVEAAREAQADVVGQARQPGGVLRVSAEVDIGTQLLAPAISELTAVHPALNVELDLSPRRVDLVAEGFDAAVRVGRLRDSTLIARQLASLRVGLYASADYIARRGVPRDPGELAAHARLHFLHDQDSGDWQLTRGRRRIVVPRAGARIAANNMTLLLRLLRQGAGIAIADEIFVLDDVRNGAVRRVLPEWALPTVALSVLTPGRLIPAKTRAFIDAVARHLAGSVISRAAAPIKGGAP